MPQPDDSLAAVFAALGRAASYQPAAGGAAYAVTVMPRTEEQIDTGFGPSRIQAARGLFDVRQAEVAAPADDDLVGVGGRSYRVRSWSSPDSYRLTWRLDTVETSDPVPEPEPNQDPVAGAVALSTD